MATPKDRIEQAAAEVVNPDPFAGEVTPGTITEVVEEPQERSAEEIKADRQDAINASYAAAAKWLREEHLAEFNTKRQELLKEQGIEWAPPLTDEQKAEAELRKLVEQHPDLAKKFGIEVAK